MRPGGTVGPRRLPGAPRPLRTTPFGSQGRGAHSGRRGIRSLPLVSPQRATVLATGPTVPVLGARSCSGDRRRRCDRPALELGAAARAGARGAPGGRSGDMEQGRRADRCEHARPTVTRPRRSLATAHAAVPASGTVAWTEASTRPCRRGERSGGPASVPHRRTSPSTSPSIHRLRHERAPRRRRSTRGRPKPASAGFGRPFRPPVPLHTAARGGRLSSSTAPGPGQIATRRADALRGEASATCRADCRFDPGPRRRQVRSGRAPRAPSRTRAAGSSARRGDRPGPSRS